MRGCYHNRSAREIITDVVISGSANVGCSRGGLVSCLLRSLSKVGWARSDTVCGSGRCGRSSGSDRYVAFMFRYSVAVSEK